MDNESNARKPSNIRKTKRYSGETWKSIQERRKKRKEKGVIVLPDKTENRIYRLKAALRKEGMQGKQIKEIVRKERRIEELKLRRSMKMKCFRCRKPGHQINDCPVIVDDMEQGTGICFKCGSTEHKVQSCSSKIEGFPYAKCFICGQQGHLSRSCPENKKGLYPHGGCCNQCGKVDHLKKDCPELQGNKDGDEAVLPLITTEMSADAEVDEVYGRVSKKKKVVKF